jgi:ribosomal protein S18 acetylase RimI-like enzyme
MITLPLVSQITIRHVTRQDLPALEWDGEYTHFRRLFAEAYRQYELGQAILWVTELPGLGIIGQLFVQTVSQNTRLADGRLRAYIYGFRVRPPYRDMGIGSRMLQIAENDLVRKGYRIVSLNVGRDNLGARRMYERFGYRIVAPDSGVWSYLDHLGQYREVNEPAWRMEKEL